MKKILALILALAMVFALAACGSSEPAFTRGEVTGNRYESSFLGIGCELDDSWHILSDEEIAEQMGQAADLFNDPEKYGKLLDDNGTLQDFNAAHESGASVNIVIQKLSGANRLLDEEQYRDLSVSSLEKVYGDATALSNATVEANSFDFVGVSHPGSLAKATMLGGDYYSQQVYIKTGSYMAIITFTCFYEEDIATMADYFFALSE